MNKGGLRNGDPFSEADLREAGDQLFPTKSYASRGPSQHLDRGGKRRGQSVGGNLRREYQTPEGLSTGTTTKMSQTREVVKGR